MKTILEIDDSINETMIVVKAKSYNEEVKFVLGEIEKLSNYKTEIVARKNNDLYILKLEEIILLYSVGGLVFAKTSKDEYKLNYRLYEIEEVLPKDKFIRISYSTIVNKDHITCFAAGIIGSLVVKLDDGTQEYVAQRRVKEIMKILRGKSNEGKI